jgi:predicted nucleotidyltransferase
MSTSPLTPKEWTEIVAERIVRRFYPLRIIPFGSRARHEEAEDSDIDLLIDARGDLVGSILRPALRGGRVLYARTASWPGEFASWDDVSRVRRTL